MPSENVSEDRQKALKAALAQINKDYGANSAIVLGDRDPAENRVQTIPAGFLSMEKALGVPGYPRGRIIEVYGPEASGKTLLTLKCIAATQKSGGTAAFIDAEQAFSVEWAQKLGVDTDSLVFAQPNSGEEALEIAEKLIRSNAIDVLVIDSVAALVPRKELEGDMGDATMGVHARLMSQGLRKLTGAINHTKTTVFFINQLRSKIGVIYGSPEVTTGGNALKYYCSVRIDVRRTEQLKGDNGPIGARTRAKIVKNKVAAPHKEAFYDLLFVEGQEGISREGDVLDLGVEYGIIKKAGAYYTMAENLNVQGKEKARAYLREHQDLVDELEAKIRPLIFPDLAPNTEGEVEAELEQIKGTLTK